MNKKILLFTLLTVFTFSRISSAEISTNRVKQAKVYMEKSDYRMALEILSAEFKTDSENTEEILKLIKVIEEKKFYIIDSANKIMNLYSKNEFAEADKLRKGIDLNGNFDDETNQIIAKIRTLQDSISKRVAFVENLTGVEKNITDYKLTEAVTRIDAAARIYDLTDDDMSLKDFESQFSRFKAEDLFTYPAIVINEQGNIMEEFDRAERYRGKLAGIEEGMRGLYSLFNSKLNNETDTGRRLVYSAYRTVAERSMEVAIRACQMVYRNYANALFDYCDKITVQNPPDLDEKMTYVYSFIEKNEPGQYAFYKNKLNFNDPRFTDISKRNIYDYLVYVAKKDKLYYKIYELKLNKKIGDINTLLAIHKKNLDSGDIIAAGESLKKLVSLNDEIKKVKTEFDSSVGENFFDSPYLKSEKGKAGSINENIVKLDNLVNDEGAGLENTKIRISNLIQEAQKKDREAVEAQKNGDYDKAKELFEMARIAYYEVTALTRSKDIDARVANIDRQVKSIDSEIFKRDVEVADKYVQDARKFLYNEDYRSANEQIKKAQELYRKNSQPNEYATKLEQRIETAIRMRREVTLNYDDGAYKNIIEWYDNAIKSLNANDYARAELFKDKILSEKPFYEKARQLEIKILLAKGDMVFFKARYNEYLNEAIKNFNDGDYTRALNGFKQLLEYNYDTKKLNDYIYNCNLKLGFIAKPVTVDERGNALALAEKARALYEAGDFAGALKYADQAINLWEDVPNISNVRIGSMRRLHKPLPSMSVDNERKYALASRAYSEENYREVIRLTEEILKTEKSEKVVQLNSNAKKLLVIKERGL